MTSPDNEPGGAGSSDSSAAGSEPSAAGYEAPLIEQAQSTPSTPEPGPDDTPPQGYTPPPAYNPPPSYVPPTPSVDQPGYFSNPPYPPPPAGFAPPPYPDAGAPYVAPGYGTPGYGAPGYGQPSYPPPPPYGAYPGGYPGAEYGYGAPAPQGSNGLAIGSLVASLLAIPLNVACFSGTIASIVAVVLGIIALNQVKKTGQSGKEMAIAGIVIGALGLIGAFVLAVLVAAA